MLIPQSFRVPEIFCIKLFSLCFLGDCLIVLLDIIEIFENGRIFDFLLLFGELFLCGSIA